MSAAPNSFKRIVTTASFGADVIEASAATPVLVDFWADWCAPCKQLMPILERLADEYAGRFVLAKVNADEEGELAQQIGVRSLPTVVLFKDRAVADHFIGVVAEAQIRQMLDKHIPAPALTPIDKARNIKASGDYAAARVVVEQALAADPKDISLQAELAELQILQGEIETARQILSDLKGREPGHKAVKRLEALLAFSDVITGNPDARALEEKLRANPNDLATVHASAVHRLLAGDNEDALNAWLQMMRANRSYQDDLARKSLVMAFELLGESDPLVRQSRKEMARMLF